MKNVMKTEMENLSQISEKEENLSEESKGPIDLNDRAMSSFHREDKEMTNEPPNLNVSHDDSKGKTLIKQFNSSLI